MKNLKNKLLMIGAMLFANSLMAWTYTETHNLNYYGREFGGYNTYDLKGEIFRQTGVYTDTHKLVKVELYAKAQRSRSMAQLLINNQDEDYWERVPRSNDYHSEDPNSYRVIELESPYNYANGSTSWQIQLDGVIKVYKVVVTTEPTIPGLARVAYENVLLSNCGKVYSCTPIQCQNFCASQNKRIATVREVFRYAQRGENYCAYLWMKDDYNPGQLVAGYPMFNYQGPGCVNSYYNPIMADVRPYSWEAREQYNCACAN